MAFYETKNSVDSFIRSENPTRVCMNFHAHLHTSFELLRVREGEIEVGVEDKIYYLKKGDTILILPNLIHYYKTEDYSLTDLVIFSVKLLPEIYDEGKSGLLRHPIFNCGENTADRVFEKATDYYNFRAGLYEIASLYSKNEKTDIFTDRNGNFALKLSEYLDGHCSERLDECSVAKYMGYHPRYLSYLINKSFGVSFKQLINEYRTKLATALLSNESISITEVYLSVGFDSQSSFNRNFKAITGLTPREYRSGIRKDSAHHLA